MKEFIKIWFLWQFVVIGIVGLQADFNPTDDHKIECSSVGYFVGITVIDITIPLIQFTNFVHRDCK